MKLALIATTDAGATTFYEGFAERFREAGIESVLICPKTDRSIKFSEREKIELHPVPFQRNPRPLKDAAQFFRLLKLFNQIKPEVVIVGSPKASLLAGAASRFLGITAIYTVHGLRYEGSRGWKREVLKLNEKMTCLLARRVICVGHQIEHRLLSDGLVRQSKVGVLGAGSANGVLIRETLSCDESLSYPRVVLDEPVRAGFVGRLTEDKGFRILMEAWENIKENESSMKLVIAGDIENDLSADPIVTRFLARQDVIYLGYCENPDSIYDKLDVLILPSFREGLPTVVLEAASKGVPAVVSDSTGTSEPVINGVTGIVVKTKSVDDLSSALRLVETNREHIAKMGQAARKHIQLNYDRRQVHLNWIEFLLDMRSSVAKKIPSNGPRPVGTITEGSKCD